MKKAKLLSIELLSILIRIYKGNCGLFFSPNTVGLSVATINDTVHNFVWLSWQPSRARNLISWGQFETTSRGKCRITGA